MKKKMKISQSALKDFYNEDKCDLVFAERYFNGWETPESEIKKVWYDGLIFEQGVLGANRSGKIFKYPRKGDGGLTVREKEMDQFVDEAKEVLYDVKQMKILMVQPEIVYKHYVAHLDAIFMFKDEFEEVCKEFPEWEHKTEWTIEDLIGKKIHILDTKFTNASEIDRYNGWADPQFRIENNPEQPQMYVWIMEKLLGYHPEFYYYIQGASGWKRFVRVRVTEGCLSSFELILDKFETSLKSFIPKPVGKNTVCRKCYFYDSCPVATRFPETEIVEI